MLDTYIKNRGTTKTIIHNNNHNNVKEMKWDADYDGDIAKLSLDLKNNGKTKHYNIKLDNYDLAKIFNIDSVNLPIDKRLKRDFKKVRMERQPSIYDIYLEDLNTPELVEPMERPLLLNNDTNIMSFIDDDLMKTAKPVYSHISSPQEELLIPLTIDKDSEKSYVLTPRKHHVKPRTHKTYRVYKHKKATSSKNSKAKGKKSRTNRKSTNKSTNKSIKNSLQEYFNI
jgi:hypothetical protein